MRKFLIILGYTLLSVIGLLYLAFVFLIPNVVNLDNYKSDIQMLVKENSGLDFDYDGLKIITSPLLEAGIKIDNPKVMLPDNSQLFNAEYIKGKVFLPSILFLTVRVSCAEVISPRINADIINSEKFAVAKAYEDVVNKKRKEEQLNPKSIDYQVQEQSFDVSKIKIKIPVLKIKDYQVAINDIAAKHKLVLKGDELKVGYFNGKVAKVKTQSEFYSDNDKNITANIDIDTFLPAIVPTEKEKIDNEEVFELPFINPVSVYRDYNLISDIDAKVKIRQNKKNNKIFAKGHLNIDNTTINLSGLQLPKSYLHLLAKGYEFDVDTNFYVTDSEYLNLLASINYGKTPNLDVALKTSKVHFTSLLNVVKAYLDTVHIKNDISNMSANGFLQSDFQINTDYKTMKSSGNFVIRDGNIYNTNTGLLFDGIYTSLLFDNNVLNIKDAKVLINQRPLEFSGQINTDSVADVKIKSDKIPLVGLYKAFAPKEIRNSYDLTSGTLTIDAKVNGKLSELVASGKSDVENLRFQDKSGLFVITNRLARFGLINYEGLLRARFRNRDFALILPATNSVISDNDFIVNIDNNNLAIPDSVININNNSKITVNGFIENYISKPDVKIKADGFLVDSDLKHIIGEAAAAYLESKGAIPLKAYFNAKGKNFKTALQLKADPDAYITPVSIDYLKGKQLLVQFLAEKNGDNVKVYKSGLFVRDFWSPFNDDLSKNLLNAKEVVGVRAIVSNLSISPFINLLKITVPKNLNGSICAFPKSRFTFGGNLFAFGKPNAPKINGEFFIRDLNIPEILTSVRSINADLGTRDVKVNIFNVNANDSDFNINISSNWNLLSKLRLANVNVNSQMINLDKLLQVSESLVKSLPKTSSTVVSSEPSDIPVEILNGNINLRKIITGDILVKNTTGKISLLKNIFYVNNLKTKPMGGDVDGSVSYNLVSTELNAKLSGKNFDVEKVLIDTMKMKDTISGDMNFLADLTLRGSTMEEQMKTLSGYLDFNIKDGQLGPFGKFENFLMAENLRENAFFSSTIGSIITNIVTIDTSRFNSLYGHLTFDNGFARILPIKSQGNVMSIYIAGDVGLIDNSADMKLRGKLASTFSDSLGPLANINPVNLIKNTPGLNIVAAKTFSIFCEAVSEEEMNALPELGDGKSDDYATKFQIVLRGDTRKPLKMIKSFKWLALNSDIESAQSFVDTIPVPQAGEESLTVEELISLRAQQAASQAQKIPVEVKKQSWFSKLKNKFSENNSQI